MMAKEWSLHKGLGGKLLISWIVFSSAYVVAFPTLLSATAGYSTRYQPYVLEPSGLVPFQNFRQTYNQISIVQDWRRIGYNSNIVGGIVDEDSCLSYTDSGRTERFSAWTYTDACKYTYLFFPTNPEASGGSRWKSDVNPYGWTIKNVSSTFQLPISRPKSYYERNVFTKHSPRVDYRINFSADAQYYAALAVSLQPTSLQLR